MNAAKILKILEESFGDNCRVTLIYSDNDSETATLCKNPEPNDLSPDKWYFIGDDTDSGFGLIGLDQDHNLYCHIVGLDSEEKLIYLDVPGEVRNDA